MSLIPKNMEVRINQILKSDFLTPICNMTDIVDVFPFEVIYYCINDTLLRF